MLSQADLFQTAATPPGLTGLSFRPEALSRAEEAGAVRHIAALELAPFQFHGFLGKRRVTSFGWRYDYNGGSLTKSKPMPDFIAQLRDRAALCVDTHGEEFVQALVTEYGPGAGIGWHRDKPHFGKVALFPSARPACCASASGPGRDGSGRTSWSHHGHSILSTGPPVTFGNTASPPLMSFAIPSPSGL